MWPAAGWTTIGGNGGCGRNGERPTTQPIFLIFLWPGLRGTGVQSFKSDKEASGRQSRGASTSPMTTLVKRRSTPYPAPAGTTMATPVANPLGRSADPPESAQGVPPCVGALPPGSVAFRQPVLRYGPLLAVLVLRSADNNAE